MQVWQSVASAPAAHGSAFNQQLKGRWGKPFHHTWCLGRAQPPPPVSVWSVRVGEDEAWFLLWQWTHNYPSSKRHLMLKRDAWTLGNFPLHIRQGLKHECFLVVSLFQNKTMQPKFRRVLPTFSWRLRRTPSLRSAVLPGSTRLSAAISPGGESRCWARASAASDPALPAWREYGKLQAQLWFHIKYSSF